MPLHVRLVLIPWIFSLLWQVPSIPLSLRVLALSALPFFGWDIELITEEDFIKRIEQEEEQENNRTPFISLIHNINVKHHLMALLLLLFTSSPPSHLSVATQCLYLFIGTCFLQQPPFPFYRRLGTFLPRLLALRLEMRIRNELCWSSSRMPATPRTHRQS